MLFLYDVCLGALLSLVNALVDDACLLLYMYGSTVALVNDFVICRCAMLLEVMERMTLSIEGKGNLSCLKQHTVHS